MVNTFILSFISFLRFALKFCDTMTQLRSFVANIDFNKNKTYCKGPTFIGMPLNIQELLFSVNSAKKVLQRRVF